MRFSKYNEMVSDTDCCLIYNHISKIIVALKNSDYNEINQEGNGALEVKKELLKYGILIEDNVDEDLI
jgi:hypothetical protein